MDDMIFGDYANLHRQTYGPGQQSSIFSQAMTPQRKTIDDLKSFFRTMSESGFTARLEERIVEGIPGFLLPPKTQWRLVLKHPQIPRPLEGEWADSQAEALFGAACRIWGHSGD